MSKLFCSAVSLGFHGDDLDPDEMSVKLGTKPTIGARKGGTFRTNRGAEKIATYGRWSLDVPRAEPGNLDEQIAKLFALCGRDFTTWRDLAKRYDGRIFCGLFMAEGNEGIDLSAATVRAIGQRGLRIGMDIYGSELLD